MLSSRMASMVQLPWFQQVMRHGVSVHIMWSRLPPSSGGYRELVVDELVLRLGVLRAGAGEVERLGPEDRVLDQGLGDVLGPPGVDVLRTGVRKCSLSDGL